MAESDDAAARQADGAALVALQSRAFYGDGLSGTRAASLAGEVLRLNHAVAGLARTHLGAFDEPAHFLRALRLCGEQ